MNKNIIREAYKKGFIIDGNSINFKNIKIELNHFLYEVNKLKFFHSMHDSIEDVKYLHFIQYNNRE